jgi:hypothetical protein
LEVVVEEEGVVIKEDFLKVEVEGEEVGFLMMVEVEAVEVNL